MFCLSFLSIITGFTQSVKSISKPGLADILKNPIDKLHVINYWASWCGPCVVELPEFQRVVNASDSTKVDFLFVSMDFPSDGEKKVFHFLKRNNYNFDVALMTDTDYNSWIDLVDPAWQGNIPVTLFINNSKDIRYFVPEPLDSAKLAIIINSLLIN
jgi:thiol-disulfide isomerase/thioredoxin